MRLMLVTSLTWPTPRQVLMVQEIHRVSLPDDITPNLPKSYYRKVLRMMADTSNGFVGLAIAETREWAGFCGVVYRPGEFSNKIAAHRFELAGALATFALTKPSLLVDLYESMPGETVYTRQVDECPEIYAIAVGPVHRSAGVGKQMVDAAVERLREEGHSSLLVKTASPDAQKFYEREGFEVIGTQDRGRRALAMLHKAI